MSIEFVAHVIGVDDDEDCSVAGIAEWDDGSGRSLVFQAGIEPPDEQDVRLGMDTYLPGHGASRDGLWVRP